MSAEANRQGRGATQASSSFWSIGSLFSLPTKNRSRGWNQSGCSRVRGSIPSPNWASEKSRNGQAPPAAGTAQDRRGESFVERRGDQGGLCVRAMAGEGDPARIDRLERLKVVHRPAGGPGPLGQPAPIELGPEGAVGERIVPVLAPGVGASDVPATHRHERPTAVGPLGKEDREGAWARGHI